MSTSDEKWRMEHGDFTVPCLVSGCFLRFSDKGSQRIGAGIGAGEVLWVDVMTTDFEDGPRELCQLAIKREDLMRVLQIIEPESLV